MLFRSANCGALPGGVALIPDASIADGVLDVAVIQPSGVFGWLGVWRKIWWDNSVLRRFRAGRRVLERRRDALGPEGGIEWGHAEALAYATLLEEGVPILGTPFESIDLAEDRLRFGELLDRTGLKAPDWAIAGGMEEAVEIANQIGRAHV